MYVWKKICVEKRNTHYNYRKEVHIFLNSVKKMLCNSTFLHAMYKELYKRSPCHKIDILSWKQDRKQSSIAACILYRLKLKN